MKKIRIKTPQKVGLIISSDSDVFIEKLEKRFLSEKKEKFNILEKGENYTNLPSGVFVLNGENLKAKFCSPLIITTCKLHLPKVKNKPPKKFKEKFGINPKFCTVFQRDNTIFWDKDAHDQLNSAQKDWIVGHEKGHYYFKNKLGKRSKIVERLCDAYSAQKMIEKGYDKNQIIEAIKTTIDNSDKENRISSVRAFLNNDENLFQILTNVI